MLANGAAQSEKCILVEELIKRGVTVEDPETSEFLEQNAQQPFASNDQSVGGSCPGKIQTQCENFLSAIRRQRSVLRCLADFRNEKTGQCNPSTDAIAKETELNRKTVYKAIAYLEEKGFVRRERIVLNSSNNYVLNIDSDSRDTKNGHMSQKR